MRQADRVTKIILKSKFTLNLSCSNNSKCPKKVSLYYLACTSFFDEHALEIKAVNNGWGSIGDDLNSG